MSAPTTSTTPVYLIDPRIVKTAGICGGDARIAGTRIPVWGLIPPLVRGCEYRRLIEVYPQLTEDDLRAAWQYYEIHKDEITQQIAENAKA